MGLDIRTGSAQMVSRLPLKGMVKALAYADGYVYCAWADADIKNFLDTIYTINITIEKFTCQAPIFMIINCPRVRQQHIHEATANELGGMDSKGVRDGPVTMS